MASAVSYEYLKSIQGVTGGIATLGSNGLVPPAQLPPIASQYKGQFATVAALQTAYPTALLADYAYVTATSTFWYWNTGLAVPAWVNQEIEETDYLDLTDAAKASVPYLVVPDVAP